MGQTKLHAIETVYAGVKFRSRLEAKWAVFYDALGLDWIYEHEGFELPSGRYLPDFYFPEIKFWVEIKPTTPTIEETNKCAYLCEITTQPVYLFYGAINRQLEEGQLGSAYAWLPASNPENLQQLGPDGIASHTGTPGKYPVEMDWGYKWCHCPQCNLFGIQFEGRAARLYCRCEDGDRSHNADSKRLLNAYAEATNRRFGYIA